MSLLKVYLAQPVQSSVVPASARALWRAATGSIHLDGEKHNIAVLAMSMHGSCLAKNFNHCWCAALNGEIDYFAMLHADVSSDDGWLGKMICELEKHELDVLSAVVPIKNMKGVTSTALDGGDEWDVKCRLTLAEVHTLPVTFTADDVGHPLLVNTGCWVAKWGPWAEKIQFEMRDRIIKNDGVWEPQIQPEDWHFSRQCNAMGLRIGATRIIDVVHHGSTEYSNSFTWGSCQFDDYHLSESLIFDRDFPDDVDGWLTITEGQSLTNLAKGKDVLEIGAYCGRSTICLARSASSVISIDPHDGRGTPNPKNTLAECKANLRRYGVEATLLTDRPSSLPEPVDLVFIDGAHDYESVAADIAYASENLKPDGVIACHDYREAQGKYDSRWDPGVTQAVDEYLENGAEVLGRWGTVIAINPKILTVVQ